MRILVASGGSGGHIFPAVCVFEYLKKNKDSDILFVTTRKQSDRKMISRATDNIKTITIGPMPAPLEKPFLTGPASQKKGLGHIGFFVKFALGFMQSIFIMLKFKPDVVVGFGGYVCGPIILAARFLRIPSLIHEQNVYPGRANKLVSKFATKIALGFQETKKYFNKANVFVAGNPIRDEFASTNRRQAREKLGIQDAEFNILVMGGSQGSHKINMIAVEAIRKIKNKVGGICVTHLTGKDDADVVKKAYEEMGVPHMVFPFLENVWFAIKAADLVIARCGASSITEFAASSLPSILIPYPYALAHQKDNAKALKDKQACVVIDDSQLSVEALEDKLIELINDRQVCKKLSENIRKFYNPDSAEIIAREITNLCKK